MTAIITPSTVKTMTTPQLIEALQTGLMMTVEHFTKLGVIWGELVSRGEDMSRFKDRFAGKIPQIASGRLAPEAFVALFGKTSALKAIEGMPLERQRKLITGEELINVSIGKTIEKLPLKDLPKAVLSQVFDDGEIRSVPQQRAYAAAQIAKPKAVEPARAYSPKFNKATGEVSLGNAKVKLTDVLHVVSAAAGPDRPVAQDRKGDGLAIRIILSPEEHEQLLKLAKDTGLPEWKLARDALRAWGLI